LLQAAKQAPDAHQVHNRAKNLHSGNRDEGDADNVLHGHLTVELSGAHAGV
jgi:hypothetical protein